MIAFVCVNFNNSSFTNKYILNLLEFNDVLIKVIVVDNASNDEDYLSLFKFINDLNSECITLIRSSVNVGYFKGLNLGLDSLNKYEFDYIIVGNNDLTFADDFLLKLRLKFFDDNVLVLAPNIIRLDGVHQNPHITSKFSYFQNLYRKWYFKNYYLGKFIYFFYSFFRPFLFSENRKTNDIEQIILMGYGACYILTKSFFSKFSKLDAPVFLMGEEGILANQVIGAGGVTLYCPDLIVNHHEHASIGKMPSKILYLHSKDSYNHYISFLKYLH
jgi:GT2 family glycosyltransferase